MSELFIIFSYIFLNILKLVGRMKSIFFLNFKHVNFAAPWDSALWGGRTIHPTLAAPI
jgi:hypothetical protein